MKRSPIDRDAKDGNGGSLPKNVMKLKALCKAEGIDPGEARTASEYQAAIIAGRMAKQADEPEAAPDEPEPAPDESGLVEIENILPGTTLHLGDGRRLAFGESDRVSPALAEALTATGQAE